MNRCTRWNLFSRKQHVYSFQKVMNGVTQYLVKWRGWDDPGDCTWEPIDNLTNVKDLIREFQDKRIEKTKKNERPEKQ